MGNHDTTNMGCGVSDEASSRAEYSQTNLTPEERSVIAEIFGTDSRPRSELKAQWQALMTDPFFAPDWAGTSAPGVLSPRCLGGDVVIECWSRYRKLAGDADVPCTLIDFEFVTAEVKAVRMRRRKEATQKLKTMLTAKGFRQALIHSATAVVNWLHHDGGVDREDGFCTLEELRAAVELHYADNIPAEMLPCEVNRKEKCDKSYQSAEFISARDLRQHHLLTLMEEFEDKTKVLYCSKLQTSLQEMFPAELGSGVWIPWLHVEEWSEPKSCLDTLEEARKSDSGKDEKPQA